MRTERELRDASEALATVIMACVDTRLGRRKDLEMLVRHKAAIDWALGEVNENANKIGHSIWEIKKLAAELNAVGFSVSAKED
jgi:hypothetical protein